MLNLRYNLLVQANFSVLEEQLPNLKMVDLRDNPLDCKGFPDKTILGVITDCEITKAVSVKTTTTTKVARTTLKANSCQPTTTTNILSSQDLDPVTSIIIYMPVLISTFVLTLVLIVFLRGVGKMFKLRRTRTLPISHELSLFNFDADSEEHVVFDVTAL